MMSGLLRRPFFRFLVYGHIWLALGAMAQLWWIGTFTGTVGPLEILAFGSFVVAAYGAMRIVRSREPELLPSPWIRWVKDHITWVYVLVGVSFAIGLCGVSGSSRVFAPWDLCVIPIVVFYLVPWRNKAGRSMGLRRIPLLKAPLIAATWALATTGLSAHEVDLTERVSLLSIAVIQFGFYFSLTIASDLIDLRHDENELRTIPRVLGPRVARFLAVIGLLPGTCWMVVMLVMNEGHKGADPIYLMPLIGYVIVAWIVSRAGPDRPLWYGLVLIDGLLFLNPLLAFLAGARWPV